MSERKRGCSGDGFSMPSPGLCGYQQRCKRFLPTHPEPTVALPADTEVKVQRKILAAICEVCREKTKAAAQRQAEELWKCLPDALLGRVLPRLSFHCAANQVSHLDTAPCSCIGSLPAWLLPATSTCAWTA